MVKKVGTDPQYIFADTENISNILTEIGISPKSPQYNFYTHYIGDKLTGTWFTTLEEMKESILNLIHKTASLNFRKKSEYRTDQENFYEPGKSDEWPKGPKKPKLRLPFYNYPDEQGNIINADPKHSNPMEYESSPGSPLYGPGICGSLNLREPKFAFWDEIDTLVENIFAKNHHMILGAEPTKEEFDKYFSENFPKIDSIVAQELYDRYITTYQEVHQKINLEKTAQEESLSMPESQVTKQELINLYKKEVQGIYDEDAINAVIAEFIRVLEEMLKIDTEQLGNSEEVEDEKVLLDILQSAKTSQEKMIAIDQVINVAHSYGVYGEYLIKDLESGDYEFFDRLHEIVKPKRRTYLGKLNMKKAKIIDKEVVDVKQEDVDLVERFHARSSNKIKLGLPLDDYSAEFIIKEEFKKDKEKLESFVESLKSEYPAIREIYQIHGANEWLIVDCGYSPFEALEKATEKDSSELYNKYVDKLKEIAEIIRKIYEEIV